MIHGHGAVKQRRSLRTLATIYAQLQEFLHVDDDRGELEGGCRGSVCRYVYARSLLPRIIAEPRPVLDTAALLAAYGLAPVVTAEHAVIIQGLASAVAESPEAWRSSGSFMAACFDPGLGVPAATLILFLVDPRRYPFYDEEYCRGLMGLHEAVGSSLQPPRYGDLREAARERNQPRLRSLYEEASKAHMEAARRYTVLLEALGYPRHPPTAVLPGLALDALARLVARGRISIDEIREAMEEVSLVRSNLRALRLAAARL